MPVCRYGGGSRFRERRKVSILKIGSVIFRRASRATASRRRYNSYGFCEVIMTEETAKVGTVGWSCSFIPVTSPWSDRRN
jgi:hypothetical protein